MILLSALLALTAPVQTQDTLPAYYIIVSDVRVLSYGEQPPYSGILHTWRKVTVQDKDALRQDIWVTWPGDDSAPPLGATCEMKLHMGILDGETIEYIDKLQPRALLDSFKCPE